MTRADLYDYLKMLGLEITPWEKGGHEVLVFYNPKTRRDAYIKLPVDETKMSETAVFKITTELGVEPPNYAKTCKGLMDEIHSKFPSKANKAQQ